MRHNKNNITLDQLKTLVQRFIDENGHEPSHADFNSCPYLPTARTIQRRFGGLKQLRSDLGLSVTDYSQGSVRSDIAASALERSAHYEKRIFDRLYAKHHDHTNFTKTVEREVPYQKYDLEATTWTNIRSDVVIDDRERRHIHFFDMFYAKDMYSFTGSVTCKRRKLEKAPVKLSGDYTHSVTFVSMNQNISQSEIDSRKINTGGARVVSYDTFVSEWLSE